LESSCYKRLYVVGLLCATTAVAQTFTTLVNFNGFFPYSMSLVQGRACPDGADNRQLPDLHE